MKNINLHNQILDLVREYYKEVHKPENVYKEIC